MKRPRPWPRRLVRLAVIPVLLGLAWLALPRVELLSPEMTWSRRVMDRDGKLLTVTLTEEGRYRLWTPLTELPPDLIAATLAHEDQRFHDHPGVDLRSAARAAWGLLTRQKSGGGSTISMQLARLRFGLETRSFRGKAVQMFRALQLERHYSKNQILEAYLNLVPCGGNVEGSGTAAWIWLGKPPAQLTFRECVALSLVPQRPARRNPARPDADPTAGPLQQSLIETLRGTSDSADASYHFQATHRPPHSAPHFTRRVLRLNAGNTLTTTLDKTWQDTMEQTVRRFLDHARQEGVANASALFVHAPTREVRAWVGSADFYNAAIRGQVDGVTARRSPGSLLKPFIYGLAMRQGLIHPQSLLSDSPSTFADYHPENFDRGYAGPLSATEALYRSRNLPAVRLMQQLKSPDFHTFLTNAGVALPHSAGYYGLALALGAEEISMLEAARLYAMLADDGQARPLRLTPCETPSAPSMEWLSPGVCFLVKDMLRPRQPAPPEESYTSGFPNVSWKTGTSHGWRDAWAAAIAGDYVLVVWAGDFRNRPNPVLTGRRTAGPLLFSLLAALKLPCPPPPAPSGLRRVDFCAVSGDLPGPHCAQQTSGWYLPGISPLCACTVHQLILTDPTTGLRVSQDDGRPGLQRRTAEVWPPHLMEMFRQAGVPRQAPPPWQTPASTPGRAPLIASPQALRTYTLRTGNPAHRTIPLQAQAAPGVRQLYWFSGREFLGAASPAAAFSWTATPGSSQIRVVDDQGRSASCQVKVELVP